MTSAIGALGLFLVGASAVDVSPKFCNPTHESSIIEYQNGCFNWIPLAGFGPYIPIFGNNRISTTIHDPIWARSLAVQGSDGKTLLLMSVDNAGLGWKHINPVRRKIAETLGIPFDHIVIQSTHDHATPDGSGFWSELFPGHGKNYTDFLRKQMYESARQAVQSMQPAKMRAAATKHFACFDPRTMELKKDPDCNLPDNDPEKNAPGASFDELLMQNDLRDPWVRNPWITAAQFVSSSSGQTIATFVNWHNHPDTMGSSNHQITSDYPHYVRQYMEHVMGGISIYSIGTLGSQIGALRGTPAPLWNESFERQYSGELDPKGNPVPVLVHDGWDKIRSIGYEVGYEAVQALESTPWVEGYDPPVSIRTQSLDIRIDNTIHLLTGSAWYYDVQPQDRMKKYVPRCISVQGCVTADFSVLQLGDIGIGTLPGEIDPAYLFGRNKTVADYGGKWGKWTFPAMPALATYLPGKYRILMGQGNGYLSYLVHKPDNVGWWNRSHPNYYEEEVTVGADFGDDAGNQLMQMLGSKEHY